MPNPLTREDNHHCVDELQVSEPHVLPSPPYKLDIYWNRGSCITGNPNDGKEGGENASSATVAAAAPKLTKRQKAKKNAASTTLNESGNQKDIVIVRSYKYENMGPYRTDNVQKNPIRFTSAQVEAIRSGTNKVTVDMRYDVNIFSWILSFCIQLLLCSYACLPLFLSRR